MRTVEGCCGSHVSILARHKGERPAHAEASHADLPQYIRLNGLDKLWRALIIPGIPAKSPTRLQTCCAVKV